MVRHVGQQGALIASQGEDMAAFHRIPARTRLVLLSLTCVAVCRPDPTGARQVHQLRLPN
jgi:hypothetical protein